MDEANRIGQTLKEIYKKAGVNFFTHAPSVLKGATTETRLAAAASGRSMTLDFMKRGAKAKGAKAISDFWGAGVQGWDTMVRRIPRIRLCAQANTVTNVRKHGRKCLSMGSNSAKCAATRQF